MFARFGIPTVVASAPPLESSPLVAALVGLAATGSGGLAVSRSAGGAGAQLFRPDWPEWQTGRAAAALAVAGARSRDCPRAGRRCWLASIGWKAKAAEGLASKRSVVAQAAGRASRGAAAAANCLDLRSTAAAGHGRRVVAGAGRAWPRNWACCTAAEDNPLGVELAVRDGVAWQRLEEALAEADRLNRWTAAPPRCCRGAIARTAAGPAAHRGTAAGARRDGRGARAVGRKRAGAVGAVRVPGGAVGAGLSAAASRRLLVHRCRRAALGRAADCRCRRTSCAAASKCCCSMKS